MEFDEWKNFWLKNGANAHSIIEKSFSHIKQHNIFNELLCFISFIVVAVDIDNDDGVVKLLSFLILFFDLFIKFNSINLFKQIFISFSLSLLSKISIKV